MSGLPAVSPSPQSVSSGEPSELSAGRVLPKISLQPAGANVTVPPRSNWRGHFRGSMPPAPERETPRRLEASRSLDLGLPWTEVALWDAFRETYSSSSSLRSDIENLDNCIVLKLLVGNVQVIEAGGTISITKLRQAVLIAFLDLRITNLILPAQCLSSLLPAVGTFLKCRLCNLFCRVST